MFDEGISFTRKGTRLGIPMTNSSRRIAADMSRVRIVHPLTCPQF